MSLLTDLKARIQLVEDHWGVLSKSWSIRLMWLAALLQTLQESLPNFDFLPWWTSLALLLGATGARIVAQRGLSLPEKGAS